MNNNISVAILSEELAKSIWVDYHDKNITLLTREILAKNYNLTYRRINKAIKILKDKGLVYFIHTSNESGLLNPQEIFFYQGKRYQDEKKEERVIK